MELVESILFFEIVNSYSEPSLLNKKSYYIGFLMCSRIILGSIHLHCAMYLFMIF